MIEEYLKRRHEVDGWFFDEDVELFVKFNELQSSHLFSGDLLEIGVYCGKSAILLGYFPQNGEQLTVCDLFGGTGQTSAEQRENTKYYGDLALETFQRNYRRFHPALPVVFKCSSTDLEGKHLSRTFRLIHVDGSHQYDVVRQD